MKKSQLNWKRLKDALRGLKFIDYVFLVLTITGVNGVAIVQLLAPQNQLPSYAILLFLALSVFLLAIILAFVSGRETSPYIFEEQSQDEADFFYKWYRQPGELTMFCTDLDWLDEEKYNKVRDALMDKADKDKLKLFLKKYKNKFVDTLVKIHGAELHQVREDIRSAHRFSVLKDEGDLSIIIRNKDVEPGALKKIRIEEYSNNSALVNVALDMLDDCEIKPLQNPVNPPRKLLVPPRKKRK
jgi:hypothetical protein